MPWSGLKGVRGVHGYLLIIMGSQLVQVIDQLAKPTGTAPVKIEHKSREIAQSRLIQFFRKGAPKFERAVR
jgi:hypothetical protein